MQFENAERMSNVPLNKTCSTLLPVGNADVSCVTVQYCFASL